MRLKKCIQIVKQIAMACAEGKPTNDLWTRFHEIEATLTPLEVKKLSRYVKTRF